MSKQVDQPLNRKQLSHHARDERLNQRVIIGTAVVLALVVLLLGWALVDQFVLRPRTPVVTVADQKVPLSHYQDLVRYRRWDYNNYLNFLESQRMQAAASGESGAMIAQYYDQQIQQVQSQLGGIPSQVVEDLIDEQIVRLAAKERGIVVTADEVQMRIEEQFGYHRNPPTPMPTVAPTATPITATEPITTTPAPTMTPAPTATPMTEEAYRKTSGEWFTAMQEGSGFAREDFDQLIESAILREKLEEQLKADVPTTAEQIHARHILVETREEAEAVLARLKAGEAFEDLAAELSTDTSNKDNGGDLGWFGHNYMVAAFEEAAFALQPGEISEVVETDFGFHIIKVEERDANREMDEYALEQAQQEAIENWFAAQREVLTIERNWDSTMVPEETRQRTSAS